MILTLKQIQLLKDHLTHQGVVGYTENASREIRQVETTDLIETIEHLYKKR